MILAGDVGGTHARLALFEGGDAKPRDLEIYPSAKHGSLVEIVELFRRAHPAEVAAVSVGVAGPVSDGRTEAVNLAWPVDAGELATALRLPAGAVAVINDMEANAWGIPALGDGDLVVLAEGEPEREGNIALISAGTGLGHAFATWCDGELRAHPSEGGHVDFAPRTELEAELRAWMARDEEHVSIERVCSGVGLLNTYSFLRDRSGHPEPDWLEKDRGARGAIAVTDAGIEGHDPVATEALDLFVSMYGAQAGNMALAVMATGGVYLGGGIAPKVLARLREGGFMRAFTDKGRLSDVVERIPVWVIRNELTALLGAARHAHVRADRRG
ncbi:MAG TPA: glucokinase [Solirubrobacterales bacterium]|nr:glucokinase [Solirubrobacterales bacterium]